MSQAIKQEEKQAVETQPESLMFSEEFLRMMQDHAYETLRKHLLKIDQLDAVELLDDLVCLTLRPHGLVTWMDNQILSEAVGHTSQHVLKLGGRFYSSSELITPYE